MTLPWKALAKKYFQERQRLLAALGEPFVGDAFIGDKDFVTKLDDKEFWDHIERALPPAPTTETHLDLRSTNEPHLTHAELMRQIEQTVKGPK
jgi:hypothetical protein